MQQLRKEIERSLRLTRAEQRISSVEDDQYNMSAALEKFIQGQQHIHNRMEDHENRSRRNNLRIIGLPESHKQSFLLELCSSVLPEAHCINR